MDEFGQDAYDEDKYNDDYNDEYYYDKGAEIEGDNITYAQASQYSQGFETASQSKTFTTGPEGKATKRKNLTKEEIFVKNVNIAFFKYDLERVYCNAAINLANAGVIPKIEYRSPIGIVLGLQAGTAIRSKNDRELQEAFKKGKEAGLENFDVLRYKFFLDQNNLWQYLR